MYSSTQRELSFLTAIVVVVSGTAWHIVCFVEGSGIRYSAGEVFVPFGVCAVKDLSTGIALLLPEKIHQMHCKGTMAVAAFVLLSILDPLSLPLQYCSSLSQTHYHPSSTFTTIMGDSAYSFSLTTFSRTGKLLPIEYALNAVANGRTCLGICCADGVVLATDKKMPSALVDSRRGAQD